MTTRKMIMLLPFAQTKTTKAELDVLFRMA